MTLETPGVFSRLNSMTALDLEEAKDYMSRRDAEYALLEQSLEVLEAQFESRAGAIAAERDALKDRLGQLEILLKGRQAALVSKEEECVRLRNQVGVAPMSRLRLFSCVRSEPITIAGTTDGPLSQGKYNQWLSVVRGVAPVCLQPSVQSHLSMAYATHANEYVDARETREVRSPPRTVYRTHRSDRGFSESSPEGASPRIMSSRHLVTARAQRSIDRYRDSFASVRSARTVSSDSDESLDELVSHAMRLSRSSAGSSVVRGSVVRDSLRASGEIGRSSFPKRWK